MTLFFETKMKIVPEDVNNAQAMLAEDRTG